jgi:lipoprotein-anchoring transpeptidase ErfK/SrfK
VERAARFEPDAVNRAEQPEIKHGDKGSAVLRAQILLARAHFSCGELDGAFGDNLGKTVSAFQQARELPSSGAVDAATWSALNSDQAPALTTYTITDQDEQGPFTPIPADMSEQAKLPALGYASPAEELGERFHVSPAVLKALNPGADLAKAGQPLTVPNVITMPPGPAARVEVSKSEGSVRAYGADGKLLAFYVATIGSEHDPLPVGDWKIRGVAHNPAFHYNPNLFWDAKATDEKATIKPGPNNPVGVVWIDLSKEHYGIHGTPEPSRIGHTTSHGCIRLTNWDAAELASMVKPGVPAILKE